MLGAAGGGGGGRRRDVFKGKKLDKTIQCYISSRRGATHHFYTSLVVKGEQLITSAPDLAETNCSSVEYDFYSPYFYFSSSSIVIEFLMYSFMNYDWENVS